MKHNSATGSDTMTSSNHTSRRSQRVAKIAATLSVTLAALGGVMLVMSMSGAANAQNIPPLFELPSGQGQGPGQGPSQGPGPNVVPPSGGPSFPQTFPAGQGRFGDDQDLDRIHGGKPATLTNWASFVNLSVRKDGQTFRCGGTVIAPEWVLTAGHCVVGRGPEDVTVLEGTATIGNRGGRQIGASQVIMHEGYRPVGKIAHNDVALIKLRSPAQSPAQVLIGRAVSNSLAAPGKQAWVAGFGATEDGKLSDRLLEVEIPLAERGECHRYLAPNPGPIRDIIDEATVCAGDPRGGKDSCGGDSGGPLVVRAQDQRAVQVGVVSWGRGCGEKDSLGVYASVAHFEDWIKQRATVVSFYVLTGPAQPPGGSNIPGTPAMPPGNASVAAIEQAAAAIGGRVDIRVDLAEGNRLRVGNTVHFRVMSPIGGQLLVYNVDEASGSAYQVFPNQYTGGGASTGSKLQVSPGQIVTVPAASDRFDIHVKEPIGRNRLYAFVLPLSVRIEDIATRGLNMGNIPDSDRLFRDLADRALRGVEIMPRPSGGGGAGSDRGAAKFEYEIVR